MSAQRIAGPGSFTGYRTAEPAARADPTTRRPSTTGRAGRTRRLLRTTVRPRRVGAPGARRPVPRARSRRARRNRSDSVPELFARELDGHQRRRSGDRARKRRDVDADTRAAGRDVRRAGGSVLDPLGELGDHRRGGHTQITHMHADGDTGEVFADPAGRRLHRTGTRTGCTPRTRAVVAQMGRRGASGQAAGGHGVEKTAAGRQADIGVAARPRWGRGSGRSRPPPRAARRPCPLAADADPVGDGHGGGLREWHDGVVPAGRLEHEGLVEDRRPEKRSRTPPGGRRRRCHPARRSRGAPIMTSRASRGLRARSSPSRTRSMPMRAGAAAPASWVVATRSLPMATPYSLTPCSAPQSQVGQESRVAWAPVSPIVRYWVRRRAAVRGAPTERPRDLYLAGRAVRVLGEDHAVAGPGHRGCRTWLAV